MPKLEDMDEVALAKLCKRKGLHPGSNSRDELIERLRAAEPAEPAKPKK